MTVILWCCEVSYWDFCRLLRGNDGAWSKLQVKPLMLTLQLKIAPLTTAGLVAHTSRSAPVFIEAKRRGRVWKSFSSHFQQQLSVWLYQPLASLWGNSGWLHFITSLQFFWGLWLCAQVSTGLATVFHTVGLRSGLLLCHCNTLILVFFSSSPADSLLCLGFLFYCMRQFWSKLLAVGQMVSPLILGYLSV